MHGVRPISLQKRTFANLGQIVAKLRLPAYLGGDPNLFTNFIIANDTGSNLQTVFTTDLVNLQYDPATYQGNLQIINVATAGAPVMRQLITVEVHLVRADGSAVSPWIQEVGAITPVLQVPMQYALAGRAIRQFLYFGTAPGNADLYVAEKKNRLVTQLPVV